MKQETAIKQELQFRRRLTKEISCLISERTTFSQRFQLYLASVQNLISETEVAQAFNAMVTGILNINHLAFGNSGKISLKLPDVLNMEIITLVN